jgi:formate dehydrogenase (hydrogenase)
LAEVFVRVEQKVRIQLHPQRIETGLGEAAFQALDAAKPPQGPSRRRPELAECGEAGSTRCEPARQHLKSSIIEVMFNTRRPTRAYDRLTQPLVRERGTLRPASWDEALDRAAAGFRRNIDAHGPDALGIFSCSKSTNEVNFMAQKIARVAFGTNNIDSCNRT